MRVQTQLLLSAAALALAGAAAARDAAFGGRGASEALVAAAVGEALHVAVVYAWDAHMRARFAAARRAAAQRPRQAQQEKQLQLLRGGGGAVDKGKAPAAAGRPPLPKAKAV